MSLRVPDLVAILGDTPREVRLALLERAAEGAMVETLDAAAAIVDAGADAGELLRTLFHDLHDVVVDRARGTDAAGSAGAALSIDWCLAASEILGRHLGLADRSRAPRATLDLALLAMARLGRVRDLEELVGRLEALSDGSAPAPRSTGAPQSGAPAAPEPRPAARPVSTPEPQAAPAPAPASQPRREPPSKPRIDLRARLEAQRQARPDTGSPSSASEQRPSPPPPSRPTTDAARGTSAPAQTGLASPPHAPDNDESRAVDRGPDRGSDRARFAGQAISSEEMARIRALPRVKEVLGAFRGRIEHVRRDG